MLFNGPFGKSLVSPEFLALCSAAKVQAIIQAFPNPGDFDSTPRVITFTSFNNKNVHVIQCDKKNTLHIVPPGGELKIMIKADEPLPIPKEEENV